MYLPKQLHNFTTPLAMDEGSSFSISLSNLLSVFLILAILVKMKFYLLSFPLHSLDDWWWTSFYTQINLLYNFFVEMPTQILSPFSYWIFFLILRVTYIFWVLVLTTYIMYKYFCGFSFHFLNVVLWKTKDFNFDEVTLFTFYFFTVLFGVKSGWPK